MFTSLLIAWPSAALAQSEPDSGKQPRIVAPPRIVTQPTSGLLGPGTRNPGLIGNDSAGLRNRSGIVSDHGGGLVGNAGGTMRR